MVDERVLEDAVMVISMLILYTGFPVDQSRVMKNAKLLVDGPRLTILKSFFTRLVSLVGGG